MRTAGGWWSVTGTTFQQRRDLLPVCASHTLETERVSCDGHKDGDSLSLNALHPCTPGRRERNRLWNFLHSSAHTFAFHEIWRTASEMGSSPHENYNLTTRMLFGLKEHKRRAARCFQESDSEPCLCFVLFFYNIFLTVRLSWLWPGFTSGEWGERGWAAVIDSMQVYCLDYLNGGRTFREETGAFVAQWFAAAGSQARVRGHR